jgi:hypothetical protein
VIAAGVVLFLVPSAWMHARGVPYVLCWLGGALAFPLLPVGWHVYAERKRAKVMVVRGGDLSFSEKELEQANQQLAKQTFLPVRGKLVVRKRGKDMVVLVTEGWAASADDRDAGKSTGPTAIIERLGGAPSDAVLIAAASPSRPIAGLAVNGAHSWLRISKTDIRLDGEMFVTDKVTAAAIAAALRIGQNDMESKVPAECKKAIAALNARVVIDTGETSVRVSARWKPEEIGEAVMCGLAAAMKDADWKATE